MKQEYVLLKQENDLLNELKGRTFDNRLKDNALNILNEIHDKADFVCGEKALCYVVRDNVVKGVGGSTLMQNTKTGKLHSDLILDNYGIWLSGVFKGGVLSKTVTLTTEAGLAKGVITYFTSSQFNSGGTLRVLLQVGSGTTAPTRADINIETAFASAPENNFFESTIPIYDNVNARFRNLGSITASGSGTINESILQHFWNDSTITGFIFTSFRDIISPGVPFINGDSIILEYTTQV